MSAIQNGWIIRLYVANNYTPDGTIGKPIGNFEAYGGRQEDKITVFSGEYGIDQYLVWEIHNDLPYFDFSTVALNLELYLSRNTKLPYFREFYRVQNVSYNEKESKYILYAVSEATVRLDTRLADYNVKNINWEEFRQSHKSYQVETRDPINDKVLTVSEIIVPEPIQILIDMLQLNQIFSIIYHPDNEELLGKEINFDYKSFSINPLTTVRELIEYIGEENNYEWCVTKTVDEETNEPLFHLHIGHQLFPSMTYNATKPFNTETDFISDSTFFKKVKTIPSPMDVLANWNQEKRCVWCKHTAGASGGNSWGCFLPIGWGHLEKGLFVRSLDGEIEKNQGFGLLFKRKLIFPALTVGNIMVDEGLLWKVEDGIKILTDNVSSYIDEVSVQKDPEVYHIKSPKDMVFQRGKGNLVSFQKQHVDRVSPYIEDGSGLYFPSVETTTKTPANSILGRVEGRVEVPIHLGFVPGNGKEDFEIPKKNPKDFRWQFPNGWCWYVKEIGDTILQVADTDNQSEVNELGTGKEGFHFIIENPQGKKEFVLGLDASNLIKFISGVDGIFQLISQGDISFQAENGNIIVLSVNGKVTVEADGDIEINCGSSSNVSIKGGNLPVSLEGHTHPTGTHTHVVTPGPAIPGPPASAQSANAVVQGETDKHSKHLKCVKG